jgi:regulatory helix-turn-helix LysR family protein
MLNLTQLKVLEAVARHGSVTDAAKELHYSQPSDEADGFRLTHLLDDPLYLVSETTVTPPGLAAANAVEPPRSPHASAPASHHASPTPATTPSSPKPW